jgi:hypothetical protein
MIDQSVVDFLNEGAVQDRCFEDHAGSIPGEAIMWDLDSAIVEAQCVQCGRLSHYVLAEKNGFWSSMIPETVIYED